MITNNNVDEYIELLKARIVLLGIALALYLTGCDAKPSMAGITAQHKAETYACTQEETKSMRHHYETCMDGAGYFSNYCFDRAVLATCHPRGSEKEGIK
jgi:hypothetical protein